MANTQDQSQAPRKLGRGLSSLLTMNTPVEVQASRHAVSTPTLSDVVQVPLNQVFPSPFQPRRSMDDAALTKLSESVKRSGVLQPILLRPMPAGGFELVAGERRWRAAKLAGLQHVPALVRDLTDEQAGEQALIENVQREDLNAMDRAWALRRLGEQFSLSQSQLAERVGLERPTVANLIRLTELEPEIAALITNGGLSAGHGKALLSTPAGATRVELAKRAASEELSVRAVEQIIHEGGPRVNGEPTLQKQPHHARDEARLAVLADLQRQIGQQLGTKVTITTDSRGKRGRITLEFYGLDHFDALLQRLGVKTL